MALLEHAPSASATQSYSLSFLTGGQSTGNTSPSSSSAAAAAAAAMVSDLLASSEHEHGSGVDGADANNGSNGGGIQVTGKVALSHSSSSGVAAPAVGAPHHSHTSVITRRSPDSPDSGNEDSSAWFLSQVLHQQQQRGGADTEHQEADQDDAPLTPATSPARGIRRPRSHSAASSGRSSSNCNSSIQQIEDDEDDDVQLLKKQSADADADQLSENDIDAIDQEEEEEEEDGEGKKRKARVESIISSMRTSTPSVAPSLVINGCKKRKLYQPQQHGSVRPFTSEGEEEDEDDEMTADEERSISRGGQQQQMQQQNLQQQQLQLQQQAAVSAQLHLQHHHDPIRSLQERIASLHQQRFAALQQQSKAAAAAAAIEPQQQQLPVRRPVRDDAGRTRNPQQHFGMRSNLLSSDLSHVSQAHAAYLDATRRLLMEQQQQRQQQTARVAAAQAAAQAAAAAAAAAAAQKEQQQFNSPPAAVELEGLAEMLKSELASSLAQLVDSTLSRFAAQQQQQQRRNGAINTKLTAEEAEMINNKFPRGRIIDRGLRNGDLAALGLNAPGFLRTPYGQQSVQQQVSPMAATVQQPQASSNADDTEDVIEQNEALSLVVSPKKRRFTTPTNNNTTTNNNNKTSERQGAESPVVRELTMRPASGNAEQHTRLSPHLEMLREQQQHHNSSAHCSPPPSRTPTPDAPAVQMQQQQQQQRYNIQAAAAAAAAAAVTTPSGPPPLLHHPSLFSNYSAYFAAAAAAAAAAGAHHHQASTSSLSQRSRSPAGAELDLTSASTSSLLHPALLAAAHHHGNGGHHHRSSLLDNTDRHSESSTDGISPYGGGSSGGGCHGHQSSTLTPMHLRKAKLMFFWVRYPSSSVLKTFFPDVNFNKNNTAQLVKWFSNFREFYYIQMEKYSRQLLSEGVVNADDIHVSVDSELFRALNLHYNRNNHIEVPAPFVFVVSETLREFFKAIQAGKDAEPSWKKAIYKIIARLDEQVPEYFRTPNFLEHLE